MEFHYKFVCSLCRHTLFVPVVHLHITYAALHWDQNLDKVVFVYCINSHEPNIIGIFWNCAWVKSAPVKSIFKNLTFLFDFKMFVSRVGWVPGLALVPPFAWQTCPYLQRSPKLWIPSAPLQWFRNPDNKTNVWDPVKEEWGCITPMPGYSLFLELRSRTTDARWLNP